MSNLAAALREQGRLDEAAALLEEATRAHAPGPRRQRPGIAGLSFNLARVHLLRGDAVAAEQLLRDAMIRQQRTMPAHDWRLAATRSALGEALIALAQVRRSRAPAHRSTARS